MATKHIIGVRKGTAVAACRSCKAAIYWVRTEAQKLMPVDCDEKHGGYAPTREADGVGVSHFATCPNAAQHRRAK